MTLQELGSIGEFLGFLAILVTLFYLAKQNRQAITLTKASEQRILIDQGNVYFERMLEGQLERLTEQVAAERKRAAALSFALDKASVAAAESAQTVAELKARVAELEAKEAATSQEAIDAAVHDAVRVAVATTEQRARQQMADAVAHLQAAAAANSSIEGVNGSLWTKRESIDDIVQGDSLEKCW